MGVGTVIQIYSPNNENYEANGDITLMPTVGELSATLNGSWAYNLVHPIDDAGRWRYIEPDAMIVAPSFNGVQRFRIKSTDKNEFTVTALAEPEGMDAMDNCFLVDVRPTNKTGQQALNMMVAPSNGRYNAVSNITKRATAFYQYKNLIEAINGNDDNSFINRWGGEILYDNRTIRVLTSVGEDRGVEIRYGKNIPVNGFTETIDFRSIVTRIYPTAYNGYKMSGTGYVNSPIISTYPIVNATAIQFSDVKMVQDEQPDDREKGIIICNNQSQLNAALRAKCNEQYANGLDKPTVTIKAQMVLLQDVIGYEEYQNLTEVSLGDTIHCYHSKLGIITDARVTKLVYDSIQEKVTSVELTTGGKVYDYFNNVTNAIYQSNTALANGANGSFSIGDKTITIDKGIITGIQ